MSSLQPMKMSNSSKSHTKKTILVKCTYYNRRYERNQLYCLQVKSNEKKDESKKNLFYNLPEDLRSKIYEYDDTFRKKFDEVLHELIYYDNEEFIDFLDEVRFNALPMPLNLAYDGLYAMYQEINIMEEEEFNKLYHTLLKKIKNVLYVEYLIMSYVIGVKGFYCPGCKKICYND